MKVYAEALLIIVENQGDASKMQSALPLLEKLNTIQAHYLTARVLYDNRAIDASLLPKSIQAIEKAEKLRTSETTDLDRSRIAVFRWRYSLVIEEDLEAAEKYRKEYISYMPSEPFGSYMLAGNELFKNKENSIPLAVDDLRQTLDLGWSTDTLIQMVSSEQEEGFDSDGIFRNLRAHYKPATKWEDGLRSDLAKDTVE
jgi:hypothetical protein